MTDETGAETRGVDPHRNHLLAAMPIGVTQDFLAQMIGVQRPALSVAMRQFKDAGLVTYSRGQIRIADRDGLLAKSCRCIGVIATEARRLETLETDADEAN